MNEPANNFAQLDAQDELSALTKLSPEEHAEMQAFLDEISPFLPLP